MKEIDYRWKSLRESTPTQLRVLFAIKSHVPASLFSDGKDEPYGEPTYVIGIRNNDRYYYLDSIKQMTDEEYYEFGWLDDPEKLIDMSKVIAWFPFPLVTNK